MRAKDWFPPLVLFCTVTFACLCAIAVTRYVFAALDADLANQSCRDRGGFPHQMRAGWICLRKEMVIDQ